MAFRFLDLPAELRNAVYEELLLVRRVKKRAEFEYATYDFHPAILRTNHQIYYEARSIFRQNAFVTITTPWRDFPDALREGKFKMLGTGRKVQQFQGHHLWAVLDWIGDPPFHEIFYLYLTCLEDLPEFCQIMSYYNMSTPGLFRTLHLTLNVRDPYELEIPSDALQYSLLAPFTNWKGLASLEFEGYCRPSLVRKINKMCKGRDPTPEAYLERATTLKNQGNVALKTGSYVSSISLYRQALEAMLIAIGDEAMLIRLECFFDRRLVGGTLDGLQGLDVHYGLLMRLMSNIILAYLKQQSFQEAYFWGDRAVAHLRPRLASGRGQCLSDPEMAKIYYRMALASKGLKWYPQAIQNLRVARLFAERDPLIEKEFKEFEVTLSQKLMRGLMRGPDPDHDIESTFGALDL